MLSKLDKKIIRLVSRDIPLVREPFRDLAGRLGITERLLIKKIRSFKKSGRMRKLSAVLNHRKIGFRYNAMVVWDVPKGLIDKACAIMASFDEVSHCYQRKKAPGWNYNLYAMVHGKTRSECLRATRRISSRVGADIDHRALFSFKEYKKTGARY